MDGKLVLGFLNYMLLSLMLIFALLALTLRNQRKKITFLFLFFLCSGIISYLFFTGVEFILPIIILLFFCILLSLFVYNQEFFGFGRPESGKPMKSVLSKSFTPMMIINTIFALILCAGLVYLLYVYTGNHYVDIEYVEDFRVSGFSEINNEIGSNYIPLIILIVTAIFSSAVWFIGMLSRSDKN